MPLPSANGGSHTRATARLARMQMPLARRTKPDDDKRPPAPPQATSMSSPQHAAPTLNLVRTQHPRAAQGIATADVRYAARMARTATCVWRVDAALVVALDANLGPPVDSY